MPYGSTTPSDNLNCFPYDAYFLRVPRDIHFDNFLLAIIVINALMAAVASCSNAVVIYTISRTPSLQTPSNILILGLAVSDLCVGIVTQPSFCIFKYTELRRNFHFYCAVADVYTYSTSPFIVISFLTLTAITVDRFLAVHLHLRYQDIITTKRVAIALGFFLLYGVCYTFYTNNFYHTFGVIILNFCIFSSLLLLNLYFIVRVSLVIRRHSLQIQSQQSAQQPMNMVRFRKSAIVMFLVIGAFILCYIPFGIAKAISLLGNVNTYKVRIGLTISETLIMINGVLNPIIYCWRIEDIRTAAVQLLRKMWRRDVT